MPDRIFAITDLEGYDQVYETCAALVESSEHRQLASAALLNATIAIALGVLGRKGVEDALRGAIENLPMAEATARGHIN